MNIDDFRYMWRGKHRQILKDKDAALLEPINIRREGHQRALLLLHGFSSSPAVFRELTPTLTNYNAIVCPTLPGHGKNIHAFSAVKASEWLSAAEHTCSELMKQYKHVDILGLSLGGLLACHLTKHVTPRRLYLLAPALALRLNIPLALTTTRILNWLGFKCLRNQAGNLCSELYNELSYRQLPISTIFEILTLIQDFKFSPPQCPTELFLGSFDEVVDSGKVAKLFATLPNVETHWLKHSAHVLPLDEDRDYIVECVRNHLK
jgi:carboxylesterase